MNITAKFLGSVLISLIFLTATASAETTRWIRLDRVAAFSKSMRSFGHNGLVSDVRCGMVDGRPSLKFTYELTKNVVTYKYAWSLRGEEDFNARARKIFKPGIEVMKCNIGKFYYGTQNIQ